MARLQRLLGMLVRLLGALFHVLGSLLGLTARTAVAPPAPIAPPAPSGPAPTGGVPSGPPATGAPGTGIPVVVAPSAPAVPEIFAFTPYSTTGPVIPVRFVVSDPDSQPIDVEVEFAVGGTAYAPATPADSSDRMTGLPAPDLQADYRLMWNAGHDLRGGSGQVQLRFTPRRPGGAAGAASIVSFAADSKPLPAPPALAPAAPLLPLGLELVSGDQQIALPGRKLAEEVVVRVKDSQGNPLHSVGIHASPATGTKATIERAERYAATTNGQGLAAFAVRPDAAFTGQGTVTVRVIGMPDTLTGTKQTLDIHFEARKPKILVDAQQLTAAHGQMVSFNVAYDGDDDMTTNEWAREPTKPVVLKVEATNAIVSQSALRFPTVPQGSFNAFLRVVPTIYDGTATIRITDPADPTIFADVPVTVKTPKLRRRVDHTGTHQFDDVAMRLEPVSGLDTKVVPTGPPKDVAQVGYGGLTLDNGLLVRLTDGTPLAYDEQVTSGTSGCTVSPVRAPLQVMFTASDGTLSTAKSPGPTTPGTTSGPPLLVPITTPVYFTPAGPGPWLVTALVAADVFDPDSRKIEWHDPPPASTYHCIHEHTIGVSLQFTFLVQSPADVQLIDANAPVGTIQPLERAQPGDRVRLRVGGLSRTVGSVPEPLDVASLDALGNAPPAYTGYPLQLALKKVAMHTAPPDVVYSDDIQVASGQPVMTVSPGGVLATIPGGLVSAANGSVGVMVDVRGPVAGRFSAGDAPAMQIAPAGTTPFGGGAGTVALHSGELEYSTSDIDLPTSHAEPFEVTRAYRSHLRSDGPLGPAWSSPHFAWLDVARPTPRWFPGDGSIHDLPDDVPPRGVFVALRRKTSIDADNSPFELEDPHGTVGHFDVDGSLRFVVDRNRNRTRYEYDSEGHLVRITDPLNRILTLAYWRKGDPVAKQTFGRLRSVTDPAGRVVEYAYCADPDPAGPPGVLKQVTGPKVSGATTLVRGQLRTGYRCSESYTYYAAIEPLEARLHVIADSEKGDVLVSGDDSRRRIYAQTYGAAGVGFGIAYDIATRITTVTDRNGYVSKWEFPASPFWDAAAPVKLTQVADRVLDSLASDHVSTMRHNRDGLLVSLTDPHNVVSEWVYDEKNAEPRARANLLAMHTRAGTDVRSWGSTLHPTFNLPIAIVEPPGYAAGGNQDMYTTVHHYDTRGNLAKVVRPRTMNAVIARTPSGGRMLEWIEENPTTVFTYNDAGLVMTETDPMGVLVTYRYFPATDPAGAAGSQPDPNGGGLLAETTRDGATTPARDIHLPGVTLSPETMRWTYNARGEVYEVQDQHGVVTRYETDELHRPFRITAAVRVAGGGASPRVTNLFYNELGLIARMELEQPSAGALSGGAKLFEEHDYDARGNVVTRRLKVTDAVAGHPPLILSETHLRDPSDQLKEFRPANAPPGATGVATLGVTCDERGLPARVREGSAAPAPLETVRNFTPGGGLRAARTPAGEAITQHEDANGSPDAQTDQRGRVHSALADTSGRVTRGVTQSRKAGTTGPAYPPAPDAPVTRFSEHRIDEHGRERRVHVGLFPAPAPGAAAPPAAAGAPTAVDALGPLPPGTTWPPRVDLAALPDAGWGPADGRLTRDIVYDAWDLPTRVVDDALGSGWVRRDAYARPYEWCSCIDDVAPFFNLSLRTYDAAARSTEMRIDEHASDRARQLAVTRWSKQELDAHGNVARMIDGAGNAYRFAYDERGLLSGVYDPRAPTNPQDTYRGKPINLDGEETHFAYDGRGLLIEVQTVLTKPGPASTFRQLDANAYNPTALATRRWTYDAVGRPETHLDSAGNVTLWRYDEHGRMKSVTFDRSAAAGGPTTATIGYAGAVLESLTCADQTVLSFEHDDGRMTHLRVTPPGGAKTDLLELGYDEADNIALARDHSSGHDVAFGLDSQGRRTSETQGTLPPLKRLHDGAGRIIKLTYPGGGDVVYQFDRGGRLRRVDDAGHVVILEHLGTSRLARREHNAVAAAYGYDADSGHLTSIAVEGLAAAATLKFDVTPDRAGRITGWERRDAKNVEKRVFRIDSAGRLQRDEAGFTPQRVFAAPARSYSQIVTERLYDGDGVVREQSVDFLGAIVPAPRLVEVREREERGRITKAGGTPLLYDRNGNLVDDGAQRYAYDALNRLTSVTDRAGAVLAIYRYDALGRLIARTDAHGTETFAYDGWKLIEVRSGPDVIERYVWGDGDDDLLTARLGTQLYTVVLTPSGSVDCIVDAQRTIVESYDYLTSGEVVVLDPQRQPRAGAPMLRLLHHCRLRDPATGLYCHGARWYLPGRGQFVTSDPLGESQGANHYALCRNDPINRRDPLGLLDADPAAGFQAALGAAWALVKLPLEALAQIHDMGRGLWTLCGGHGHWRPLSGVGKMADAGMGTGDIFVAMGKGIVGTPGRMWDAAQRGDAFAFGEEAMNLYMIGKPVVRGAASIIGNRAINLIGRTGPRGAAARFWLRTQQLRVSALRVRMRLWSRYPPASQLRFQYGGVGEEGLFGRYNPNTGVATIYERAFARSWTEIRAAGSQLLRRESIYYVGRPWLRWYRPSLGIIRLLKGQSVLNSALHEAWHAVQAFEDMPWYGDHPQLREVTMEMGARFEGAHDYAALNAPPAYISPVQLAAPFAFGLQAARRRR